MKSMHEAAEHTPAAAVPDWLALMLHSPALPLAKRARLLPLAPHPADKQQLSHNTVHSTKICSDCLPEAQNKKDRTSC